MPANLVLVLFLVAPPPTATPTPAPTPTAAPDSGRRRTLSDVARERKLRTGGKGAVTVAPPAKGSASEKGAPAQTPTPAGPSRSGAVEVDSVAHNDVVGARGELIVFGKIRNRGSVPVCNVRVTARLYDNRGLYLMSSEMSPDQAVVAPGETVSFSATVTVPPGVRGSTKEKQLGDGTSLPQSSLEGSWTVLGRPEAEVSSWSEDCGGAAAPRS